MKRTILFFLSGGIIVSWALLSSCVTSEFTSDKSRIKVNETVQFTDRSTNNPNFWNWTFTGGNPSSSSSQNPRVNYPTEGIYPVSLTSGNRWSTDTETKSSFITVEPKECKEESFTPASHKNLCPTHTGGDKEFDGHGPEVESWAKLRNVNNKEIYADLYLHEKETRSDWTECSGNWSFLIYTAPTGWKIEEIITDIQSTTNYTDTDHALDVPTVSGGRLVSKFEIMGDTGGNDVDHCTSDDAYMNVFFNKVKVKICEN